MKLVVTIAKIMMILVGVFFIIMSLDVFVMEQYTIIERIGAWFINSLPGIILIIIVWFLWNKEQILGIFLMVAATFFIFMFGLFENFPDRLFVFLIVCLPLYIAGTLFIVAKRLKKEM